MLNSIKQLFSKKLKKQPIFKVGDHIWLNSEYYKFSSSIFEIIEIENGKAKIIQIAGAGELEHYDDWIPLEILNNLKLNKK